MDISKLLTSAPHAAPPMSPVSSYSLPRGQGAQTQGTRTSHARSIPQVPSEGKDQRLLISSSSSAFTPESERRYAGTSTRLHEHEADRLLPHFSLGPPLVPVLPSQHGEVKRTSLSRFSPVACSRNVSDNVAENLPCSNGHLSFHQAVLTPTHARGHYFSEQRRESSDADMYEARENEQDCTQQRVAVRDPFQPESTFRVVLTEPIPPCISSSYSQTEHEPKYERDPQRGIQPQMVLAAAHAKVDLATADHPVESGHESNQSAVKPFHCPFHDCDAVFGQKGSLTRHLKNRHSSNCRPHACDLCSKTFSEKWTLNVHRRNVHLKLKAHHCPKCNKSFGEKWNLRKHINVVHLLVKPFSCPTCRRAFGYKGDMVKHVAELHSSSTAQRPFVCEAEGCGVKFARMRYLRRHQNLNHKTEVNSGDKVQEGLQYRTQQETALSTPLSMRCRERVDSFANSPITPMLLPPCAPSTFSAETPSALINQAGDDANGMSNLKLFANIASGSLRPRDMQLD